MDASLPVSVHPDDCARMIAALANSGGGCFIIKAEHETVRETGRKALTNALTDILPPPVIFDTKRSNSSPEERSLLINSIVCPAHLSVREVENGLIVAVTPGDAFCTLNGEVLVFDGDHIQTLTIADVVRRTGSGG